jgi:DNA-binding XRE family transcriptional regulator
MDLDEYLWKYKLKMNKLAKDVEVSQPSISSIKSKRTSPSLLTALKLYHISKGKINLEHLLTKEQSALYEKWKDSLGEKKTTAGLPKAWKNTSDLDELDKDPEFQEFKEKYTSQIIS